MAVVTKDMLGMGTNILNPQHGGFNRFIPQYGSTIDQKQVLEFLSNTPEVKKPLLPIIMNYPLFFDYLPQKDILIKQFVNIIEVLPTSITGLTNTVTLNVTETPTGASELQYPTPTKATLAQSTPNFIYQEIKGYAIQKFFEWWIKYLIKDPTTQEPLIMRDIGHLLKNSVITNKYYSFSCMFIEYTDGLVDVNKVYMLYDMMPKTGGDDVGERNPSGGRDTIEQSIDFTAYQLDPTANTFALARKELAKWRELNYKNPLTDGVDPGFTERDPGLDGTEEVPQAQV